MQLIEKYRPNKISDFVGLAKPKKVLENFAANPQPGAWLFTGASGTGKTVMAHALAGEVSAKLHVLPAQECTRDNVAQVWRTCQRHPGSGLNRHLILVDQADSLIKLHQSDLRHKLDNPGVSPHVIWVFTAESAHRLDLGFSSRCRELKFSTYGAAKELATWLELIWESETLDHSVARPNFTRIIKEANADMRVALNCLEEKLR